MLPGITWTLLYIPLGGRGSGGEARGEVESQAHQDSYKEKVDYFPETTFYISGESWQSSTRLVPVFDWTDIRLVCGMFATREGWQQGCFPQGRFREVTLSYPPFPLQQQEAC